MAAEDRGPQVAAVAILFLILSWIAVSLRCYVRICMIKNFGADDWLAVGALVRSLEQHTNITLPLLRKCFRYPTRYSAPSYSRGLNMARDGTSWTFHQKMFQ